MDCCSQQALLGSLVLMVCLKQHLSSDSLLIGKFGLYSCQLKNMLVFYRYYIIRKQSHCILNRILIKTIAAGTYVKYHLQE